MSKSRFYYADAFKFLAILGVIVAHIPPSGRFGSTAWAVVENVQQLTGWCVLAFFMVAGALFKLRSDRPLSVELRKRALRLLVPWLAFSVFYKAAISVLAFAGAIKNIQPIPALGKDVLLWLFQPVDPQLYFLVYLFVMQAAILLLRQCYAALPLLLGITMLVAWLVFLLPDSSAPTLLHGSSSQLIPLYFAFLTLGLFCGMSLWRTFAVCLALCMIAAALVFVGADVLVAWQLAAPWILLLALRALEDRELLRPLAYLGRLSGVVYVWHAPLVIGFVSIVSVALLGSGLVAVFATVAISFAVAAAIGMLVNQIPQLRWFHI